MSEPIVTTALSVVDGAAGVLRLRGYSLEDLVDSGVSYARAVGLLATGALPADGDDVEKSLQALDPGVSFERDDQGEVGDVFGLLRGGVTLLADVCGDPRFPEGNDVEFAGACGRLVGLLRGHEAADDERYAGKILRGIVDENVSDDDVDALDRCFLVHLDHALNPGTLCARVVASTAAPLSASITAGLCALQGPLHGGASSDVGRILEDELGSAADVDGWLAAQKEQKKRVPGFGHPIYQRRDPRSAILKALAVTTADRRGQRRFVDVAVALDDAVRTRSDGKLFPNVDFYAAALYATLGVPRHLHTPLFFAARVVGWALHAREQKERGRVISPEAGYDGATR